jgi:hypothetical protein
MKKFIVNKNLNRASFSKTVKDILYPSNQFKPDLNQNIIDGLSIDYKTGLNYFHTGVNGINNKTGLKKTRWFIVTKRYLELIDKLNLMMYDGSFYEAVLNSSRNKTITWDIYQRLFNTLMVFNKNERMILWEELKNSYNLITEEEYTIAENECEGIEQVLASSMSWNYNEQFDYYTVKHSTPLKLETRWTNSENNPTNSDLYILTILPSDTQFNSEPSTKYWTNTAVETACVKFFREDTGTTFYQVGYMAHSLTDRSGEGEVQLDHIDKIDYLDTLELAIKLPKEYY